MAYSNHDCNMMTMMTRETHRQTDRQTDTGTDATDAQKIRLLGGGNNILSSPCTWSGKLIQ